MLRFEALRGHLPQNYNDEHYQNFCLKETKQPTLGDSWHSAVLVLLLGEELFFIKRSEEVSTHKGQVAFVGGRRESTEVYPRDTALREFEEETSLSAQKVEVLGHLPHVYTSKFQVLIPVVAEYTGRFEELKKNLQSNGEWVVAFGVSLNYLLREELWAKAMVYTRKKLKFELNLMSLDKTSVNVFHSLFPAESPLDVEYTLWGASARIVRFLMPHLLKIRSW